MRQDVKKYIDSEVEVSKLRVESLLNSSNLSDVAINRLIDIERYFQDIDFDSLNISSVSDAMTAVRLFRSSKKDFIKLYLENSESTEFQVLEAILKYRKSLFQNISVEGEKSCVTVKDKIRRLVLVESSLKLFQAIDSKLKILGEVSSSNKIFSEFTTHYPNEIFGFYDESVNEILTELTRQKKPIYKIKNLTNIIASNPEQDFHFSFQKIISHGKMTKGIVLPIKHLGRETSWVCFKKIIISGIDFSEIFSYTLKNVFYEGKYYKAIILKDKKEISEDSDLLSKYNILSNLFYQNILDGNLTEKKGLDIDIEKSKIYTPSSRTEDNSLRENWQNFLLDFKQIINGVKHE
jgi:hypothetical protein